MTGRKLDIQGEIGDGVCKGRWHHGHNRRGIERKGKRSGGNRRKG